MTDNEGVRRVLETASIAARDMQPLIREMASVSALIDTTHLARHMAISNELVDVIDRMKFAVPEAKSPLIDVVDRTHLENIRFWADMQDRFFVPNNKAIADLFGNSKIQDALEIASSFRYPQEDFRRLLGNIQTPWIDSANELISVQALAALGGIAHAIEIDDPFDRDFAQSLRVQLGDWRSIAVPPNLHENLQIRSDFYLERGFNSSLTAFSPAAFQEIARASGLGHPSVEPVTDPGEQTSVSQSGSGIAFARTNRAHDAIQQFEDQIRAFIDRELTAACGPNWYASRIPEKMRAAWIRKRKTHLDKGRGDFPLISFADFTDYVEVIVRKDNWRDVFGPIFRHQTLVQESFRRMYPIRLCTMHSRPITQDDELYLIVEVKRLRSVIGTA